MVKRTDLISQFLIGATSSGSGKTTLSLGLMRLLNAKGLSVGSCKCGPDYIDTQFHYIATGNRSVNLDLFMGSEKNLELQYATACQGHNVMITEGVMGLFDGYDKWKGSSYHIASVLKIPVILVVNGASSAYSVAAIVSGFKDLRNDIEIKGVIFNRVSSQSHFAVLKDAVSDIGVECYGYIKKDKQLEMPSRHLGLELGDHNRIERYISYCEQAVSETVDVDKLLHDTLLPMPYLQIPISIPKKRQVLKFCIANDEAFSFFYEANIEALKYHHKYDIEISFFSPLKDKIMPVCDFLYLPGGYPELYADRLSANDSMRNSIRDYCLNGGKVLAECGGMIYLSEDIDGKRMCNVLPFSATMNDAKLHLGYRKINFKNLIIYGHEFHYSHLKNADRMESVAEQYNAKDKMVSTPVYKKDNVIGSYTHLYWPEVDIFKLWDL